MYIYIYQQCKFMVNQGVYGQSFRIYVVDVFNVVVKFWVPTFMWCNRGFVDNRI